MYTQSNLSIEPTYVVGEKEFNYTAHEILRPVFRAFNLQMQNGLRMPPRQEETILSLKRAYFADPAKKWHSPQGEEAEAHLKKCQENDSYTVKEGGADRFWYMEQNQNWFWQSSLFCAEEDWVTLGNAEFDSGWHVVNIPTRRVWDISR